MLNAIYIFNDWPSLKSTVQEISSYISYQEYDRLKLLAICQPFWIVVWISVISRYLHIIKDFFLLEKQQSCAWYHYICVQERCSFQVKVSLLGDTPVDSRITSWDFLYARLKNGRIMLWQCPSVCPSVRLSVRPSFPDFFSTCFEISIWNLVYAFSRWHDMSSLSFITIGSLWPSLQPKVGQTQFLQLWPYKSR